MIKLNFDKEAFIKSLSPHQWNAGCSSEQTIGKYIIQKLEAFLNPPKYQMLYKDRTVGTYGVSTEKFGTNTEFYDYYTKYFPSKAALAIRFLKDE